MFIFDILVIRNCISFTSCERKRISISLWYKWMLSFYICIFSVDNRHLSLPFPPSKNNEKLCFTMFLPFYTSVLINVVGQNLTSYLWHPYVFVGVFHFWKQVSLEKTSVNYTQKSWANCYKNFSFIKGLTIFFIRIIIHKIYSDIFIYIRKIGIYMSTKELFSMF